MPFGLGILSTKAERPTIDGLVPNGADGTAPGKPGGSGGGGGLPVPLGGSGGGGGGPPVPLGSGGGGGGATLEIDGSAEGGWAPTGFSVLINPKVVWVSLGFGDGFSSVIGAVDFGAAEVCWEDFASNWGIASVCADFSIVFFSDVFSVACETKWRRFCRIFCLNYN